MDIAAVMEEAKKRASAVMQEALRQFEVEPSQDELRAAFEEAIARQQEEAFIAQWGPEAFDRQVQLWLRRSR